MTILQKLLVKQSEIRESINTLLGLETRTEEQDGELSTLTLEAQRIEPEIRAAIVASPDPAPTHTEATEDTEARQRRELSDQSDMGRIVGSVFEHRAIDGREGEMQTEFGLASNQVPLSMLRTELRAVTPAPANVGQTQNEIIPYVFPQSVAAFLGVDMPTVGVGEAIFPVLTKKLDVRTPAESGAATETTGAFSAEILSSCQVASELLLLPRGPGQVRRHGRIPTHEPECGPGGRTGSAGYRG